MRCNILQIAPKSKAWCHEIDILAVGLLAGKRAWAWAWFQNLQCLKYSSSVNLFSLSSIFQIHLFCICKLLLIKNCNTFFSLLFENGFLKKLKNEKSLYKANDVFVRKNIVFFIEILRFFLNEFYPSALSRYHESLLKITITVSTSRRFIKP